MAEISMALDANHDIFVVGGVIVDVLDGDSIRQSVKTRLLAFEQDWFLDLTSGLPWFTQMTGAHVDLNLDRSLIAEEVLSTHGVDHIESIDLSLLGSERILNVSFRYVDDYGNTIQEIL